MSTTRYGVVIEDFARKHYIKSFSKKYKASWDITLGLLIDEFSYIDALFDKSIAETIIDSESFRICKTEFKIAGTKESRKASGNRCVVAINKSTCIVHVLLVYGKNDIPTHNETIEWKQIIKENYREYAELL